METILKPSDLSSNSLDHSKRSPDYSGLFAIFLQLDKHERDLAQYNINLLQAESEDSGV
jgi:hypothetical protein